MSLWPFSRSAAKRNPKAQPKGKTRAGGKTPARKTAASSGRLLRHALLALVLVSSTVFGVAALRLGLAEDIAGRLTESGYSATVNLGLKVEEVLVEGRARTESGEILSILAVERGSAILRLDTAAARARLEALPWVKQATVQRRLPGIVYVRLVERQPMALWQLRGELQVIDQDGEVIPGTEAKRFAGLPLVVGAGAPPHTAALLALLDSQPALRDRVDAAVRVSDRRWNLRLAGGVDVRLPEEAAEAAWAQLARIEREHGLLARDVVMIDLRLPDRLIVRTAGEGAEEEENSIEAQPTSGEST
ncbi:MAG: cell division protein FtsQ/DivIB [Rhodovibrionaceae bacterium]